MTVVFAQAANAFACRSSTGWPGALGWTTNRLLVPAAAIELLFSFVVLLVASDCLGPRPREPAARGLGGGARCRAPLVLAVDAVDKRVRARRREANPAAYVHRPYTPSTR